MTNDTGLSVQGLGKRYALGDYVGSGGRPDTLKEVISRKLKIGVRRAEADAAPMEAETSFWALRDVSFGVGPGESLAILGRNGAGKSTLLKLLAGITEPTEGTVDLRGGFSALLEVGTGFHPDLTARENVYLNGAILGMSSEQIDERYGDIVAFSEVDPRFMETPVKRLSSGMKVRVAFGVAIHLESSVMIFDEVLAVGDVGFREKCMKALAELKAEGKSILFVTHSMARARMLGDRGLLLRHGRIAEHGALDDVIQAYLEVDLGQSPAGSSDATARQPEDAAGPGGQAPMEQGAFGIVGVQVTGTPSQEPPLLSSDEPVNVDMTVAVATEHEGKEIAVAIDVYSDDILLFGARQPPVEIMGAPTLTVRAQLPGNVLTRGRYRLKISAILLSDSERVAKGLGRTETLSLEGPPVRPVHDPRLGRPSIGLVAPTVNWEVR